jgi:hypothetical protein
MEALQLSSFKVIRQVSFRIGPGLPLFTTDHEQVPVNGRPRLRFYLQFLPPRIEMPPRGSSLYIDWKP